MEIRFAAKEDIEGVLKLQPQVHRVEKIAKNSKEVLVRLVDSDYCDVVVVKEDSKIVGSAFIFYHPSPMYGRSYAMLEDMVVDETFRSKGLGSDLMKKIIQIAKDKGSYKMIFNSGFDREKTHKFYEKFGFKKWGLEFRMDLY